MRYTFLIAVVIVAALIVSGFFIINYFKQSSTADELEEQIATSNNEIQELAISSQSLATEIDDLKINQTSIQNAIEAENVIIAYKTNANEIIRDVMELGLKNGTSVIPLSNSDWTKVKIQQSDYEVSKLNLTIGGSEYSIINFIRGLQDLYPTLVIENIRIGPSTDDQLISNLGIAIYSR